MFGSLHVVFHSPALPITNYTFFFLLSSPPSPPAFTTQSHLSQDARTPEASSKNARAVQNSQGSVCKHRGAELKRRGISFFGGANAEPEKIREPC